MMPHNEEFFINMGKRIEERRNAKGLSATDAADAIGISRGYWGNLEKAINTPNAVRLMASIAEYLETTTDYLLGLSANPLKSEEPDGAARLFEIYIQLSDEGRRALVKMAAGVRFDELLESASAGNAEAIESFIRHSGIAGLSFSEREQPDA